MMTSVKPTLPQQPPSAATPGTPSPHTMAASAPPSMKLSSRLGAIAAIAVAGVCATGLVAYFKLASDIREAEALRAAVTARQELLTTVHGQLGYGGMIHRFKNLVIRGNPGLRDKFQENDSALRVAADKLAAQPGFTENDRKALATIVGTVNQYKAGVERSLEMWRAGASIADIDKAVKVDDAPALAAIAAVNASNRAHAEQAGHAQTEIVSSGFRVVIAMFGVIAVAIVALLALTYRALARQLGGEPAATAQALGRIAEGDLSTGIELRAGDGGSLLAGLSKMQDDLRGTVHQIKEATESIGIAAKEIAQGNADFSQRTEQQAASLRETASSIEQLTSMVRQNAESARQANQLVASASETAARGGQMVSEVITTMEGISGSSQRMSDIIGVIDGIAFQTNILALNAAVEAARAGEQGRGFAVVASEVRNLAQRSADAAKEIKTLIEDSVGKVSTGSRIVEQAGQTISDLVGSVRRVTDIMAEISAASQEQSTGIDQVNTAVTQIDQVTQQNAALVEQAAAAAESMEHQTRRLTQMMARFRLAPGAEATKPRIDPALPGSG